MSKFIYNEFLPALGIEVDPYQGYQTLTITHKSKEV